MVFQAQLGERKFSFTAPNEHAALLRAKGWETNEALTKLSLLEGKQLRTVWEPVQDDFGIVPKPPRNWKWLKAWGRLLFHHIIYHPIIPVLLLIKSWYPKFQLPQNIEMRKH